MIFLFKTFKNLFFIFSILGYGIFCKAEKKLIESVAAIVNEEPVFYSDLKELERKIKKGDLVFVDGTVLMTVNKEKIKTDRKTQLDFMINEKIFDIEFKKLKLFSITDKQARQEMSKLARQGNLSLSGFYRELRGQGISIPKYKSFFKKRLERQALIKNQISNKIEISNQDILTEYIKMYPKRKNSSSFQYTLAQILFVPGFSSGKEGALQRAQSVYDKLSKNPEDFRILAKKYSEDPNYVEGGLLGVLKEEEIMPNVRRIIRPMAIGEISPVIEMKKDIRIIKIIDKKLIESLHFKSLKDSINRKLFEKVFQEHLNHWIKRKRILASIRINLSF